MGPTPRPLPDLPEEFGNPWMANLHQVGLPDEVPWTPLAPGWYVLAGLAVVAVLWIAWRLYRRWAANGYRREALQRLAAIETVALAPGGSRSLLADVARLVKQTALVAYPRAEVASLSGDSWLAFLDGTIGSSEFSSGCGRPLTGLVYRRAAGEELSDDEASQLLALVDRWVRRHRRGPTESARNRGR